jgi:arylsulfatase A-like enzyme
MLPKALETRAGAVLVQAAWFGLFTGLAEAALTGVKRFALGRFVRFGPDLAWMAPVANAMAFLAIGAMLLGAARIWAPIGRKQVATLVFAFCSLLGVLLMYYPLHAYARLLLALGAAWQIARMSIRYPRGFNRMLVTGLRGMTAIALLLGVLTTLGPRVAYRRQVAALPPAPPAAANVLLIVWDTVRAQNLSLYGYQRPTTPHLESWARSSVVFDQASSTSPWTLPGHASILTGQWAQALSTNWEQGLDREPRTLAEVLSAHGYVTAGFVANTYYCGHELGLSRGFLRYDDYVASPQELLISSTLVRTIANHHLVRRVVGYHDNLPRRNAADITDQFLNWQAGVGDRPFFAFLNYFDAHETYLPPAPFDRKFGDGPPQGGPEVIQDVRRSLRRDWGRRPAEEIRAEINMYDGAIAYLDAELDRLLTTLQARGALDDTIVIVTSDHGEQFGEHELFLHGNSLYQPLLHVPLILRFPKGASADRRVTTRVTLRDIPATIVDLLGVRDRADLPGASLARHWSGGAAVDPAADFAIAEVREAAWARTWAPSYPAAKGDMASVTDNAYHYIRNGDGSEELYAVADTAERQNLSDRPESRPLLERYRAMLRDTIAREQR